MPRRPRQSAGGFFYHVSNIAAGPKPLFTKASDYRLFEEVLAEVQERINIRLLSYCVLPDRWQLLVWPRKDGDLSEYMRLVCVTHAQRWHFANGTVGSGAMYKSRFKAFPVQKGKPLMSVCRYIESAALRAKKTRKAEKWQWCSLWHRLNPSDDVILASWPTACPKNWKTLVNRPFSVEELAALDNSAERDAPYGEVKWQRATAIRLGLESTMRRRGRPRKTD